MKSLYRISIWLLALLCVPSCATLKRGLTVDTSKSDYTASELTEMYHPEGVLQDVIYECSVDGPSKRRMLVYLPAEYGSNPEKRYPVFYIFHGARGNETAWIIKGNILHLTDSLYAQGALDPFILVMPNMNQYSDDADMGNSRFKQPLEAIFETDGAVETGFVHDVVGTVDSLFRTIPDKKHRAISGLSLGGLQSIFISANHPDVFDMIGLYSPMHYGPVRKSPYSNFYKKRNDKMAVQFSDAPRLYSLFIGNKDVFYMNVEHFRADLHHKGFPFQYSERKGGHNWDCWQEFYCLFAQQCFGR